MNDDAKYYDIPTFLTKAAGLGWIELISYCNQECYRTMERLKRVKRNDPMEYTYRQYYDFVHPATYFFTMGGRPATLSDLDFQQLKPIVESLVGRGQWKADSLTMFQ